MCKEPDYHRLPDEDPRWLHRYLAAGALVAAWLGLVSVVLDMIVIAHEGVNWHLLVTVFNATMTVWLWRMHRRHYRKALGQ